MLMTLPPTADARTGVPVSEPAEPRPSWPLELLPQHHISPFALTAQVCRPAARLAITWVPTPVTWTGWRTLPPVLPLPIWPSELLPQHQIEPSSLVAQVCDLPGEIAMTWLPSALTWTGVPRSLVVP